MKTRHRASIVCVYDRKLLTVLLKDPTTKVVRHFLPGGEIDPGESPLQAAERETYEETGYHVRGDAASEIVLRYPFVWDGITYHCTTHFFRAKLVDPAARPDQVHDESYVMAAEWITLEDVRKHLDFDASILEATERLLKPIES